MEIKDVFKQRSQLYYRQLGKYLKYVFNDHFVVALLILTGALGFTYSDYVETVSAQALLPRLILSVVLFSLLTFGSIRTLIEPADGIYLLPLEKELEPVMKRHLATAAFVYGAGASLLATVTLPLVFSLEIVTGGTSFLWYVMLISLKLVDVNSQYQAFKVNQAGEVHLKWFKEGVMLLSIAVGLFLSLVAGTILAAAMLCWSVYQSLMSQSQQVWNWEKMIDSEQKRIQALYRLINLFVETPYGSHRVHRLKWLDGAVTLFDRGHSPHAYYINRVFFRQTSFSGLYLRLLLIGSVFMLFSPAIYLNVLVSLLFLYLIGFQLLPLKQVLDETIYFKLYPVKNTDKIRATQGLLARLLLLAGGVFALSSFGAGPLQAGLLLITNGLFVWGFVKVYMRRRLRES
ncbi:ABC transporter, permease protein EscB [Alkalibacterium sp. AK22]|uniref:ABC transporter permease n=1 Tax=Alkalibacterium sp. AK22 TaxID=1229520 RepID=UPI00044EF241|nr:ABC transporter permease [Alkalibacterium sp. AK22]EXJ22913.1 ABC transporter, permease protein EscB [Alkalibacterium sp. AK22]